MQFKKTDIGKVPDGWQVVRLEQVAAIQTGLAKGKKLSPAESIEVPYLRVANVQDGYVDLSEVKLIRVGRTSIPRYSLRRGDVLFNEGGDADKVGRGCVWRGQLDPCLHQNHVFVARPDTKRLRPEFLSFYGASDGGKAYFLGCAKQTTNLASINSTQLKAFPIPIPPLEEQAEIAAALDACDAHVVAARAHLDGAKGVKAALANALLTGQLRVTTVDPAEATT